MQGHFFTITSEHPSAIRKWVSMRVIIKEIEFMKVNYWACFLNGTELCRSMSKFGLHNLIRNIIRRHQNGKQQ